MMGLRRRALAGAALIVAWTTPALASGFRLAGPEVIKLDWSTRSLVAHDLDGDDRTDLAVINNDRARIELLYQRKPGEKIRRSRAAGLDRWEPVLDDAAFRKQIVSTGIRMFALAVGDLDGDGSADLAYTGAPEGLTIRYQRPKGVFTQKRSFDVADPTGWIGSLIAEDLDGDRRIDLALLGEEELQVFMQTADGELDGPRSYALAENECFALKATDVDGDGRIDLVYQVATGKDALRVRFGLDGKGFGPEQAFRVETTRGILRSIRYGADAEAGFVRVQADTGMLEILGLDPSTGDADLLEEVRPRIFSSRTNPKSPASYAIADFDADGRSDIAVGDGRGARIWLLFQTGEGEFSEAAEFPSLADVRSLAATDLDGDGRPELLMASPKERVVAWTTLEAEGRLGYPRPLPTRGRPQAVAAGDIDGDGTAEVAYAFEDKKERGVAVLSRDSTGEWQEAVHLLEDMNSTPRGLLAVDANRDGREDLLVFVAHEPVRFLLQDEDGGFAEASSSSGFRRGLVDDVEPSAVTVGDVDGDGRNELLIAAEGYARSLAVGEDGSLEVLDQYNARSSDTRIAAALVVDIDGDDVPEVVLVEKGGDNLQVLRRRRNGVYRHLQSTSIAAIDLVGSMVVDLTGDGSSDILLLGNDRFLWLPLGEPDLKMAVSTSYETDLRDVSYSLLGVGDFNSDGRDDVVAIDARITEVLELLSIDDNGDWQSELHFTVFDVDPHYEGQRGNSAEPRELVVADLNDDGSDDLALLVHDRVLVYPQR